MRLSAATNFLGFTTGISGNGVNLEIDAQWKQFDQVRRALNAWVFVFGHRTQVWNPILEAGFEVQTHRLGQHGPRFLRVSTLRGDV